MNTGIDVVAAFNPIGDIRPVYVRIEDENHVLKTCKIENVTNKKTENYSGINAVLFSCSVQYDSQTKEIRLRFYCDSHKWVLVI